MGLQPKRTKLKIIYSQIMSLFQGWWTKSMSYEGETEQKAWISSQDHVPNLRLSRMSSHMPADWMLRSCIDIKSMRSLVDIGWSSNRAGTLETIRNDSKDLRLPLAKSNEQLEQCSNVANSIKWWLTEAYRITCFRPQSLLDLPLALNWTPTF